MNLESVTTYMSLAALGWARPDQVGSGRETLGYVSAAFSSGA
jgi:hypothetical protein